MIEEKRKRSKTYHKKDIGLCAKSVRSPIVLLQRLHIGANGALLARDTVTNKLDISEVKINEAEAVQVATTIKKSELKKSSNTILNNVENEESAFKSTNRTETTTELQSTLTDVDHAVGLSTTKSYKFKKKLKCLQKVQLNKSLKAQSGNKLNQEISSAVGIRRKLSRKIKTDDDKECIGDSNSEKDNLITDPAQEQIRCDVLATEKMCSNLGNSDVANYTSKKEETIQINISTRSELIRKTGANVQNSSPNISKSLTSQAISDTSLLHENTSDRVDNTARNKIYTRNKSLEIAKTNNCTSITTRQALASTANACPAQIGNASTSIETSEKQIFMVETTDTILNNDSSNSIKTRSKAHKANANNSEKPSVSKSTPKQISNKSSLNNMVLNHKVKESNSAGIQDNSYTKKSISTRSKLSDEKKIDDNDKSFSGNKTTQSKRKNVNLNVFEVQTNSKFWSVAKTGDNLKLISDVTKEKETAGRSTISTRKKTLEKMKISDDKKLKTRQSFIENTDDLLQNSSISNLSQTSSPEETIQKSKVDTDALAIKENKIEKYKITTRSELLGKQKTDEENYTDGNKVIQAEENSASSSSEIQFDNEFLIQENVLDQSISSVDLNKAQETPNEGKKILTRSKTFDKRHTIDSEKNIIENNLLQSEEVQPVLPSVVTAGKKSLSCRKSSDKLKVVNRSLKILDNDAKNIISTRNRLHEKAKVDVNKQLAVEKPSIDTIIVQSKENQSVSNPIDNQISNELSASEKLLNNSKQDSTGTPKKIDTISTMSIRSKVEKKKSDNHEKSVENEKICLEQNDSISDFPTVKNSEQPLPSDNVKDSLRLLNDTATKENTLTRSKSHYKKKNAGHEKGDVENKIAHVKQSQLVSAEIQINSKPSTITSLVDSHKCLSDSIKATENMYIKSTISTRSKKTLEKDKIGDLENSNLDNNSSSPNRITNLIKTPKKIDLKSAISTTSKFVKTSEAENNKGSIADNEIIHVEQNNSPLNSSQAQSSNESTLSANNSQILPHAAAVNINDSGNTIATRSGLTRKTKTDAKPLSKNKKALAENQHSPSKSQTYNKSTAQKIVNVNLGNETNNCNINKQQQVCSEKEIVIKLFRCDQSKDICSTEKRTPKKKMLQGKRKREREPTVQEVPKAKKSKQRISSDNNAGLPVPIEIQQLVVDNQEPFSNVEDIGESVVEPQNNVNSNVSDVNVTKSIKKFSENREATEKGVCLENGLNINTADNTNCVTENPEMSEKENQCDNGRVENEKEIIVNSSGDNNTNKIQIVEEMLENRDEGISVDTSENEVNAEIHVNHDDVIIENNTTTVIDDNENHSLLARKMVEEVINDWDVADDDKTDNIDSTDINEDFSTPEVIQIDDNEDLEVIVDVHQAAVSTQREKDPSHNVIPTSRENVEPDSIDISDSPPIETETSDDANAGENKTIENKECNNMDKESRESNLTSEQTSEVSEAEDADDSNFESIDESSCAETFVDENRNDQEDNVSQETITYYNSEDISMDIGAPANSNTLNDVVMNLKDACDKITADLSAVNTSYENNEESLSPNEPELLYISDDSNEMEEEEEEVVILEPQVEIYETQPSPVEEQRLMISNHLQQVIQQGSPSISVIKASELRDEILEPPVDHPIKPSGQQVIVYPQRQMLSTTLLPASIIRDKQYPSSVLTEDSIIQCPKCRCEFVGKSRLRRHWLTCGDAMYLYCPFCTTKVKQRRSLIHHLNTQHPDQISRAEAIKVVEQIVKQTRKAAGVKLYKDSNFALRDLLRNTPTIPVIELPAYIRIQCVMCNKIYDEIPATYKKTCDDCSSDLMTAICQLCRKQYMLSTKIAVHVQGNCIFSGRIKCRDCDFVSSSRYHLQEHIIRKHIYLAPEDYYACRLGCGKTFRVQDALKKHERICSKEADLNCRFCKYKTKHRSAMKMHVQQHIVHEKLTIDNNGTVQVCGQQDKSGTEDDDRDLITEQQVRSVIRVHCSRCNRTLRLTSNRSSCEHCKLSFTFSCSRCPNSMRWDSLHAARLHVIRSHSVKIHECPHCTERFSYVYDLTRHTSKCKAKKFRCEHCNYRANEEYKIRQHKRRVHFTDTNELPLCKKCGKWFNRGDSLRRHEKMLCGVEPGLSCEHCQFKTKTKFSLLRHIQSQHAYIYENFSFVCDRCNKFYTNMFAYEEHVKNCHALYKN